MKKIIFCLILLVLTTELCYAGSLMSGVASEYYKNGLMNESKGNFFAAKVFFQKALLLDLAIPDREIIIEKLAAIDACNDTLPGENSNVKMGIVDNRRYNSCEKCNSDSDMVYQIPMTVDEIQEGVVSPVNEADIRDQSGGAEITRSIYLKPGTKKSNRKEFVSHYTGKELFLRRCYTPLCTKIILNNFGISFAESMDFDKTEGLFKEALNIDYYFKPARINLEILDEIKTSK